MSHSLFRHKQNRQNLKEGGGQEKGVWTGWAGEELQVGGGQGRLTPGWTELSEIWKQTTNHCY